MARQLTLIEISPTWRLDDATREAGRRGVAEARASLQAALSGAEPAPLATGGSVRQRSKARKGTGSTGRTGRPARSHNRSAA